MGRILSLIGTILISSSIGFVASYLYSYNPEREIIAIEIVSETGQQNQSSYLGGVVLSNNMSVSGLDILEIAVASDDFDSAVIVMERIHELQAGEEIVDYNLALAYLYQKNFEKSYHLFSRIKYRTEDQGLRDKVTQILTWFKDKVD